MDKRYFFKKGFWFELKFGRTGVVVEKKPFPRDLPKGLTFIGSETTETVLKAEPSFPQLSEEFELQFQLEIQ